MNFPVASLRSLRVILSTLVPIVALAACGYLLFTSARRDTLLRRDYRALTTIVNQVRDRLEGQREKFATTRRAPKPPQTTRSDASATTWPSGIQTSVASDGGTRLGIVLSPGGGALESCIAYEHKCDATLEPYARDPIGPPIPNTRIDSPYRDPSCQTLATSCACTKPPSATAEQCEDPACQCTPLSDPLTAIASQERFFDAIVVAIDGHYVVFKSLVAADLIGELERQVQARPAPAPPEAMSAPLVPAKGDDGFIAGLCEAESRRSRSSASRS